MHEDCKVMGMLSSFAEFNASKNDVHVYWKQNKRHETLNKHKNKFGYYVVKDKKLYMVEFL